MSALSGSAITDIECRLSKFCACAPHESVISPSRHLAATQQFGRFRNEAAIEPDW